LAGSWTRYSDELELQGVLRHGGPFGESNNQEYWSFDWLFLYFELAGNGTATKERPVWRGYSDASFFRMQDRLLFLELHTCENPVLIVDDNCLLECRCCRLFKCPVNWIIIDVVITIFDGMKLQDKSVADAVLCEKVRLLTISKLRSALNTCRFSVEISFPPEIETMYGLSVVGCMHVFFSPKNCAIT